MRNQGNYPRTKFQPSCTCVSENVGDIWKERRLRIKRSSRNRLETVVRYRPNTQTLLYVLDRLGPISDISVLMSLQWTKTHTAAAIVWDAKRAITSGGVNPASANLVKMAVTESVTSVLVDNPALWIRMVTSWFRNCQIWSGGDRWRATEEVFQAWRSRAVGDANCGRKMDAGYRCILNWGVNWINVLTYKSPALRVPISLNTGHCALIISSILLW